MGPSMAPDDPEDCKTFTRRPPPPGGAQAESHVMVTAAPVIRHDGGVGTAPAEDDDGPITDVDDGPPTFSVPGSRPGGASPDAMAVTLVNAAPPHQRLVARVVTADETHLFVAVDGEPTARRISRVACFEHPIGGGWSTWRLSGADRDRWHVPNPPPKAPSNPEDVSA
jgi:hypothetical protein